MGGIGRVGGGNGGFFGGGNSVQTVCGGGGGAWMSGGGNGTAAQSAGHALQGIGRSFNGGVVDHKSQVKELHSYDAIYRQYWAALLSGLDIPWLPGKDVFEKARALAYVLKGPAPHVAVKVLQKPQLSPALPDWYVEYMKELAVKQMAEQRAQLQGIAQNTFAQAFDPTLQNLQNAHGQQITCNPHAAFRQAFDPALQGSGNAQNTWEQKLHKLRGK